jgi:hypothetical protein
MARFYREDRSGIIHLGVWCKHVQAPHLLCGGTADTAGTVSGEDLDGAELRGERRCLNCLNAIYKFLGSDEEDA